MFAKQKHIGKANISADKLLICSTILKMILKDTTVEGNQWFTIKMCVNYCETKFYLKTLKKNCSLVFLVILLLRKQDPAICLTPVQLFV